MRLQAPVFAPSELGGWTELESALGTLRLEWSEAGLTRIRFSAARASARRVGDEPRWVSGVADALRAHVRGEVVGYEGVPLDLRSVSDFAREVYARAVRIEPGTTCTYGELARSIGRPAAARAVGAALGKNPLLLVVPCHRVIGARGELVGFSAAGGVATKRALLALEAQWARAPRDSPHPGRGVAGFAAATA